MSQISKPNNAYYDLINYLRCMGKYELNARTNVGVTVGQGGHGFKLDLSDGRLPVFGNRRYFPHIAAAEVAWQTLGTQDPSFILKHAPKLWSKFIRDEKLETAYGYRWMNHFGRDQISQAISCLINDPTNRQLYVSAWDPALDGLGEKDLPPNIPCPVGFSVTRVENKVHMSVFMRSSDVFVGLPYDVMGYALTLDAIAASADCDPGTLHFTLAHPHFYDPHKDFIEHSVETRHSWLTPDQLNVYLPGWDWDMIAADPNGYVNDVKLIQSNSVKHDYSPLPEVIV